MESFLLEQGFSLHAERSTNSPWQNFPPGPGGGLLHWRERSLVPEPHVTLHPLHEAQGPQPPSTGPVE